MQSVATAYPRLTSFSKNALHFSPPLATPANAAYCRFTHRPACRITSTRQVVVDYGFTERQALGRVQRSSLPHLLGESAVMPPAAAAAAATRANQ